MVGDKQTCALCGLEIAGDGVRETVDGRELRFCCQGCARVYLLARDTGALEQVLARTQGQGQASAPAEPPAAPEPAPAEPPARQEKGIARFSVQGMHCPSCPKIIVRTLLRQQGILEAEVSLETGEGQLRYDPARADLVEALRAVEGLGMGYRTQLIAG